MHCIPDRLSLSDGNRNSTGLDSPVTNDYWLIVLVVLYWLLPKTVKQDWELSRR